MAWHLLVMVGPLWREPGATDLSFNFEFNQEKLQTSHRCKCMEIEPIRNKFFTPQILARGLNLSSFSFASKNQVTVVLQSKSPAVMSGKSRKSRSGTSQAGKSYAKLVKTVSTLKSKVKSLNTLKTEVTNNAMHEILKLEFERAKLEKAGRIDVGSMIGSVTYIIFLCFFLSLSVSSLSVCFSFVFLFLSFRKPPAEGLGAGAARRGPGLAWGRAAAGRGPPARPGLSRGRAARRGPGGWGHPPRAWAAWPGLCRPPRAWGLGPPAEGLAWPGGGRPPARPGLSRGRAARRGPGGWGHPPRAWAAWPGLWEGRGPRGVGDAPGACTALRPWATAAAAAVRPGGQAPTDYTKPQKIKLPPYVLILLYNNIYI